MVSIYMYGYHARSFNKYTDNQKPVTTEYAIHVVYNRLDTWYPCAYASSGFKSYLHGPNSGADTMMCLHFVNSSWRRDAQMRQ